MFGRHFYIIILTKLFLLKFTKVTILMSEDDRKAFNFLNSYWSQIKLIEDEKHQLELFKAICQVQFLEKDISDIQFENVICKLLWESMKYNIKKSIDGYKSQQKIDEKLSKIDFNHYVNNWNILAEREHLTRVIKLTDSRKLKINARINESQDFKNLFIKILEKIQKSEFLKGQNEKNWKVCFDWIVENDKNYIKILEGKYE